MRKLLLLSLIGVSFAQNPFESKEGVVGYIVIEKGGKIENYLVVQEKDGRVKTVRVSENPSRFLNRTEEGEKR